MISDIRVFLCDDDHLRFFGEGPCRLLHLIEETGSLRAAAMSMGMAYTKALAIMRRAEKNLGFPAGLLGHSAEDCAAVLGAMVGHDPWDSTSQ